MNPNESDPLGRVVRWRPEVTNPALVNALSFVKKVIAGMTRNLRVSAPPGRDERFTMRLRRALSSSALMAEAARVGGVAFSVHAQESFGKPMLVSVDLSITPEQAEQLAVHLLGDPDVTSQEDRRRSYRVLLSDLLERVVEEVWDNPEIAPVGVRCRFLIRRKDTPQVLLDLSDIGYQDETARPGDIYARLGPPASDPRWRP